MATPRFDGVELFLQIVESGNLTEAAERLNLTRSAVGKGLARLEARLGTCLLQRSTRRQRLTEDGQAYYEHCLRALAELEAAESVLESGRQQPRGRLRVSVPLAFGHHYAAPALWALLDRYPELEIDICFSDRMIDLVQEGFDMAVRIGPLPDTDRLSARRHQYAGTGQGVGIHDPLGVLKTRAQFLLQRRQDHRHAGDFQAEHQGHQADGCEGQAVPGGTRGREG